MKYDVLQAEHLNIKLQHIAAAHENDKACMAGRMQDWNFAPIPSTSFCRSQAPASREDGFLMILHFLR